MQNCALTLYAKKCHVCIRYLICKLKLAAFTFLMNCYLQIDVRINDIEKYF